MGWMWIACSACSGWPRCRLTIAKQVEASRAGYGHAWDPETASRYGGSIRKLVIKPLVQQMHRVDESWHHVSRAKRCKRESSCWMLIRREICSASLAE